MSWAEDTRCLHCDGKLPLFRKFTNGQFCSAAHRKAYWQEQERLAVERLHQTHDSLRAYRPAPTLEPAPQRVPVMAPWSPAVSETPRQPVATFANVPAMDEPVRTASHSDEVKIAGFMTSKPRAQAAAAIKAEPFTIDLAFATDPIPEFFLPSLRAGLVESEWGTAPGTPIPFFRAIVPAPAFHPDVLQNELDGLLPGSVAWNASLRIPFDVALETPELDRQFALVVPRAEIAVAEIAVAETAVAEIAVAETAVAETAVAEPAAVAEAAATEKVAVETVEAEAAAPEAEEAETVAVEPEPVAPVQESMLALARIGPQPGVLVHRVPVPEPLHSNRSPLQMTSARMTGGHSSMALAAASDLMPLAFSQAPIRPDAPITAAQEPQAMDMGSTLGALQVETSLPALAPELCLAPGGPYRMSDRPGVPPRTGNSNLAESLRLLDLKATGPSLVRQPELELGLAEERQYMVSFRPRQIGPAPVRAADAQAMEAGTKITFAELSSGLSASPAAPVFPRLRPLAFKARPKTLPAQQPAATNLVQVYPEHPPLQPAAKLSPIEGALQPPSRLGLLSGWPGALRQRGGTSDERMHAWSHAAEFLRHAPRDLKLLAIAIPVLLGLALRPSLPKVKVAAPAVSAAVPNSLERGLHERLMEVRRTVADRAAVALNDDFRSGLDDWQTRGDLSAAWSFDRSGFVKPGKLALYRPSLNLSDYEMEFLGLIDRKALNWVVRAADFDNYYVIKLVVLKPGPVPDLGITRYAVIGGKAQNRVDTPVAINARADMLYRVNLNVRDDTYLLTLQGKVVDTWTEARLRSGGIGFFSQQGEESRLRWVQVTHQYDMLGRLCAYLAPYELSKN